MSTPKLDANQLARQRKKIEKDRRRKQYDDLQVQGTNNSSIVSKRSVEMLYTKEISPEMGEWFKFFVPKPKRRSPAINRGYWIRMESIRQMVLRIIEKNLDKEINVVNLGCGFDPLPFQLLNSFKETGSKVKVNFLDFDYPELIENKLRMIKESPEICTLINYHESVKAEEKEVGIVLSTENYKLVGCDLKDEKLYRKQIDYLLSPQSVNIFIAEVSLAYMKPEFANAIIDHSSLVANSHFIILEQILPDTKYCAFAQKMMYHFNHLRSPLQCVESYPLPQDQIRRFHQYYPHVEIKNLLGNWLFLVDENTRSKWEEFIIFCQHYVIVHASNMAQMIYDGPAPADPEPLVVDDTVKFSLESELQVAVKFPAVETVGSTLVVHGGLDQTRTDRSVSYSNGQVAEMEVGGDVPSPRMCHTLTAINGQDALLIGGRSRPGQLLADVYRLRHGQTWEQMPSLADPRARHSAVRIGNEVLVFGGLQQAGDLFVMYGENSRRLNVVGDPIVNLDSCAMAYNGEFGVIVGGMENPDHPWVSSKLYKFTIDGDTVRVQKVMEHPQFARIGAKCLLTQNKLLIIGGVSTHDIVRRSHQVITLALPHVLEWQENNPIIKTVEIPESIYVAHPPVFIGFGVVEVAHPGENAVGAPASAREFLVLAGGAVCYSFGSCYNSVYRLNIS
ncbi:LCM-domain-containing protein [Suhomyces tanzawaensis NRRL Y-17324]|uniref:tRNA wybutosine-synthesizing protein 4 n=1 Tax=Suhomyces tanzawaensis NRRL Y-17324 TaxID=984487 RepID=A0A1E4SDR6_9ASCO|nr:LCM-domain-containing protein [Suhomyces tanzawaensis NRRL Y-17324]ODV77623.1 LCM-domain-containing protein [Suhomyces tanzawaensis NRRL Y-17324]